MTNQEEILKQCWERLMFFNHPSEKLQIFIDFNSKTLSLLDGKPINPLTAFATLETWIQESLKNFGAVYLYTCKDNAEISIDSPYEGEDMTPDEYGNRGPYEIQHDIPNLFIGFD